MDFVNNISRLTLGIKFDKSFRVLDIAGKIVDTIVYGQESPFDSDRFPLILEGQMKGKVLRNDVTDEHLSITDDNIILSICVDKDYSKKMVWLKEEVVPFLEKSIFKNHRIENINRIGFIFHHKLENLNKLKTKIKELGDSDENFEPENINLIFSKKMRAPEVVYNKDITDYRNAIFTLRETKDSSLIAEMDFQHFFIPPTAELGDCEVGKILTDAENYLKSVFYSKLESYVCET